MLAAWPAAATQQQYKRAAPQLQRNACARAAPGARACRTSDVAQPAGVAAPDLCQATRLSAHDVLHWTGAHKQLGPAA